MRFGTASGRTLGALHAIGGRSRPVDATTDCRSLALPTVAEADRHYQVCVLKRRILRDITERSVPRLIKPSIRATPVTRTCKWVQLAQQEQKWRRQENFGERVAIIMPNALAIIAVLENPDLKALRLKSGVADAQVFAARLLPDPTVQGSFDKILSGPDPLNGFGGQIGFDIGALRARHVTAEGARAARQQVRLDLALAEWQTAGAARLQGTRLLALVKQLELGRQVLRPQKICWPGRKMLWDAATSRARTPIHEDLRLSMPATSCVYWNAI